MITSMAHATGARALDASSARGVASSASSSALRALADPATVQTPEELLVRLRRLEVALGNDGRVVFPAMYVAITSAAVRLVARGPLQDRPRSRALIVDFGKRYLDALQRDLAGEPVPGHWRVHFASAAGRPPSLRTAMSAINAHLTVDLAEALFAVGADRRFSADFAAFGTALADATPAVIAALARHGVDGATFLRAGAAGSWIDAVAGAGTTSKLMFQTVRAEAFTNAMHLRDCAQHPGITRAAMNAACGAREATLDLLLGRAARTSAQ